MDKQLELAVNHALNNARLAQARAMAANPMMGLDSKRPQAWGEYGFPEVLTTQHFVQLYKRGGVAFGGVNKLVGNCWKTDPWVIEGEKQDESRDETAWEKKLKAALPEGFWAAFAEADKRRLVCRYSGLVLRIKDDQPFDQPVKSGKGGLAGVIPVWEGALKVKTLQQNSAAENYGQPTMWQYTEAGANGLPGAARDIHPDRIIILGDWTEDAVGFLEPAYNAFVSLEKVEGGSGEAFLKNASRQAVVSFDKEVDLANLASMYGVTLDKLQDKFNEAAKALNQGIDSLLLLQGASASTLTANVPDPGPTYNVNLQTAGAALDIPTKILVGMQTGERASSEDQKYHNARCQSRRVRQLGPEIRGLMVQLMRLKVIDTMDQFTVMWDDLTEAAGSEKLANAKTMSEINDSAASTGQPIFTDNEIRVAAGFEPVDEVEPLPEEEEDDEEDQTADPAKGLPRPNGR